MNTKGTGGFVKGVSGNPNGRPKKEREQRFLEITLSTVTFDDWKDIVTKAVKQAKTGDAVARKWLSDYLMGPPVQRSEVDATVKANMSWKDFIQNGND